MTVHTPGGSAWPARLAYAAASIFIAASGTINVAYGWGKGDSLATSIVWAAVAGAVAIVLALSWPALIRSVDCKRWSAAAIALVALLLSSTYSITCALGSAAGSRMNATVSETATTEARKMAQAAYDAGKVELDALNSAKPATEIQAQIAATSFELAKIPAARSVAELEPLIRRACPSGAALKGQIKTGCPRYDVELARAWERSRLAAKVAELTKDAERAEQRHVERRDRAQTAMEKASAELARIQPARVANSDAKALTRYLGALGLEVGPDRLNDLLVLLAVIMVEIGGGLSLAVGMVLSDGSGRADRAIVQGERSLSEHRTDPPNASPERRGRNTSDGNGLDRSPAPNDRPERSAHERVLSALRAKDGVLFGSQVALGAVFGWSKTRLHEVLHELEAAGRVRLSVSRQGTAVRLVAGAA
jgi:hypothetical protein